MARTEAPTKSADLKFRLVTIAPDSLANAAKLQSDIGLTSIGKIKFKPAKKYPLMGRDNLRTVNLDDDHPLFIASNFMFDAAARIFGPDTFDPLTWQETMLKTQGTMQADKSVTLNSSPYAYRFLQLSKTAAKKTAIEGTDTAFEYIAARAYLYAKNNTIQDQKRKISHDDVKIKLSLLNSLVYTRKDSLQLMWAVRNDNFLRNQFKHTKLNRNKDQVRERRLQIFAQMNNLQVMQPLLDEFARDIVASAHSHTTNSQEALAQTDGKRRQPPKLELETPSLKLLDRLARRETIIQRPNERVGAFSKEWDHTQPTTIANSAMYVETSQGKGWMPFESSQTLDQEALKTDEAYRKKLAKIKEIYIVQHGVMRNAKDYQRYFMEGLGKNYDPETMLVISPQFLAPVDLKEPKKLWDKTHKKIWGKAIDPDTILRWRYNDWKCAEPAMNPDSPVDSFTAMDSLLEWLLQFTPNAEALELRGNSEGGQFMDRYLAFSKALNKIQYLRKPPLKINGILSNPGSLLHFNPTRPVFDKSGEIIRWKEYAFDSRENTWPFGMYDITPYVRESLLEWPSTVFNGNENVYEDPLEFAIWNYLSRTTLAIGEHDDVVGGFHLPKGPGPAYYAQGNTRYRRMKGKFYSLIKITNEKPRDYYPQTHMIILQGVEHNAWDVFRVTEAYQRVLKEAEKHFGSLDFVQ